MAVTEPRADPGALLDFSGLTKFTLPTQTFLDGALLANIGFASPFSFGAKGDGVTDDAPAFRQAFAAAALSSSGILIIPTPSVSYRFASTVAFNGNAKPVSVIGAAVSITPDLGIGTALQVAGGASGDYISIQGLRVTHPSNNTADVTFAIGAGAWPTFKDCTVNFAYRGFQFSAANGGVTVSDSHVVNCITTGSAFYVLTGSNNIVLRNVNCSGAGAASALVGSYGIVFDPAAVIDTFTCVDSFFIGFYRGLASSGTGSGSITDVSVDNTIFDGNAQEACYINPTGSAGFGAFRFAHCYFRSINFDGVSLSGTGPINRGLFVDCVAPVAGRNGYYAANASMSGIVFSECTAYQGSVILAHTWSGFYLDTNVVGVTLDNCKSDPTASGSQKAGLQMNAGAVAVVNNCDFTGNNTSPIAGAGYTSLVAGSITAPATRFRAITGFTPYGSLTAPTVPTSTTSLVNPFPFDTTIYLTAGVGGVTVKVGGTQAGAGVATMITSAVTGAMFTVRLAAGATIQLTYTNVPTWAWMGD